MKDWERGAEAAEEEPVGAEAEWAAAEDSMLAVVERRMGRSRGWGAMAAMPMPAWDGLM